MLLLYLCEKEEKKRSYALRFPCHCCCAAMRCCRACLYPLPEKLSWRACLPRARAQQSFAARARARRHTPAAGERRQAGPKENCLCKWLMCNWVSMLVTCSVCSQEADTSHGMAWHACLLLSPLLKEEDGTEGDRQPPGLPPSSQPALFPFPLLEEGRTGREDLCVEARWTACLPLCLCVAFPFCVLCVFMPYLLLPFIASEGGRGSLDPFPCAPFSKWGWDIILSPGEGCHPHLQAWDMALFVSLASCFFLMWPSKCVLVFGEGEGGGTGEKMEEALCPPFGGLKTHRPPLWP